MRRVAAVACASRGDDVNSSFLMRMGIASAMVAVLLAAASSAAATPSVDREWVSGVTEHDATLNAEINPNSYATSYYFEIDTIRSDNFTHADCPFGPCTSISLGPPLPAGLKEPPRGEIPSGTGDQVVSVEMADIGATLQPGTTYFYRVIAHQAFAGGPTAYGDEQAFTTSSPPAPPQVSPGGAGPVEPSLSSPKHRRKHHRRRRHRRKSHTRRAVRHRAL